MTSTVLTFAPRPMPGTHELDSAQQFGRAAIWHLAFATNPKDPEHEFHTARAVYYVRRAVWFARYALAGGTL